MSLEWTATVRTKQYLEGIQVQKIDGELFYLIFLF